MVTLFHDMMHKEIEVYVDYMIAKYQTEKEHVKVLGRLFLRLRKFQLKLNPAKCTFGVMSGKFLGFVVSEKGVEIDPDKVKAIQELSSPCSQKDVKHYLFNAQELMPPSRDKPLILYLTVFRNSMRCVLGQHDESRKKEKAIDYLIKGSAITYFLASRALEDYEPLNFDFLNEDLMYVVTTEEGAQEEHPWKLNFDGLQTLWVTELGQSWYSQMEIVILLPVNLILIAQII
ncbi:RNA-directed DNA polymerase (Reverse transcriptase), Ribonuclease H-like protein [Gossypium australe]|uniref:RNA-directed DNA polymerase (Reverse transcriptase), Ribonuclease H-like protein n=1 Tax=Gossypium australe TaxID=47621 RepID=A0A5B6WCR5_9ROSI|nr:RNA-directed DNA polymerase (Reverse transcriptase), Ribonuclease H-like protein [Gossypium australe]